MTPRLIDVAVEQWPLAGTFTISRGSKTEAVVVVATVGDDRHRGRGEAVPYARYGETVEGVVDTIRQWAGVIRLDRTTLIREMPAGAARNAIDCALLDFEAKSGATTVPAILGLELPQLPCVTCYTISLAAPDAMAAAAAAAPDKPLLKLKLGGGLEDAARLQAVREARPDARLVADANEAWSLEHLEPLMAAAARSGIELVEQPLPAGSDMALARVVRLVPICADESAHTVHDVNTLRDRYDAINIKLDKAGGLTAAHNMAREALAAGLEIMVGCMVGTSLSMAPAWHLAGMARWIDLDGPLLLAADREHGITYAPGALMNPPTRDLWG